MTEAKHTPGPWVTDGGAYVQALFHPTDGGKPFYRTIAHTGQPLVQPPEMGANSNLIAAAPDLLAALKIAAGWGYGQPPSSYEEEIVQKAIAKAEGRA